MITAGDTAVANGKTTMLSKGLFVYVTLLEMYKSEAVYLLLANSGAEDMPSASRAHAEYMAGAWAELQDMLEYLPGGYTRTTGGNQPGGTPA